MFRKTAFGRAAVLAASTAIVLGAAVMGSAAQDKTTITFANWATAEAATRPGIEEVIANFEKANPDIDVQSETISFSEIARQLLLLAATGGLEPLSTIAADTVANLKPGSLSGLEVDGSLVALPWNQAPAGFWYNKAIMEKAGLDPENPPKTIDELNAALKAIKESQPDVIPLGVDTTNRAFSLSSNWPWMLTFGAKPVGADATGAESAEMKAYLTWMRDLADKGYIEVGRKIGEFRPLIAQDKVAFLWDQVLVQGVIQTTNKMSDEDFYKHYGVTVMPTGAAGKSFSFEGGHQLVMFKDREKKEAAWKFMNFLATDPGAIKTYTIGYNRSLPPVAQTDDEELKKLLDTPVFTTYSTDISPTIAPQPYGPQFAAAATAIMAGVQEAVTSSRPIDEIAASIQQQLAR